MEAMEGESVSYNPELTGEEADDDEKDVSAQVDQFFNELDLELAQRRKALKSLTKVRTHVQRVENSMCSCRAVIFCS